MRAKPRGAIARAQCSHLDHSQLDGSVPRGPLAPGSAISSSGVLSPHGAGIRRTVGLAPPILSLYDPPESGEGSIDPLSLQPTYERLAERIYPFVTVRMKRPRFLTAIAAVARVCEGFEDELAKDGTTPAWLVWSSPNVE